VNPGVSSTSGMALVVGSGIAGALLPSIGTLEALEAACNSTPHPSQNFAPSGFSVPQT
jgi:hypothetical protein